jgi:hypothetical protein
MCALLASRAEACSCVMLKGTAEEQVTQSRAEADAVFVARLVRSALKPGLGEHRVVVEDAQFEVLEIFKGGLNKGQIVRVYQVVSGGSCGRSSTNDPPWVYSMNAPGEEELPAKVSKEWLIFAYGPEPYELSQCSRSNPMNLDGGKDAKLLRKLAKKASARH